MHRDCRSNYSLTLQTQPASLRKQFPRSRFVPCRKETWEHFVGLNPFGPIVRCNHDGSRQALIEPEQLVSSFEQNLVTRRGIRDILLKHNVPNRSVPQRAA